MLRFANAILVVSVLCAAFALYTLEHQTRSAERHITSLNRSLDETRESIKLLKAEWSSLTRPERIQKLAADHLNLVPTSAQQFVSVDDLLVKVPAEVPVKLEEEGSDPIGAILEKMQ